MPKKEPLKLSKYLEKNIPHYYPNKGEIIDIIQTIADSTIPIRGLLEKGITSREIQYRMDLSEPKQDSKNIYEETQIHEDILTHSIITKALQESERGFAFIASEEAEPIIGDGKFGITIDPVDGSSNVIVNRTVGTIVGIYDDKGEIICSLYVLYGVFTNLILAIDGKVAEFILDTVPYSLTFYHYIFRGLITLPNPERGGIRCIGGDSTKWSEKCKNYVNKLRQQQFKNRYSGSLVGDFHAILYYGGVYSYFVCPKPKIRLYYEWSPLAFIAKTLGGEFLIINEDDSIISFDEIESLNKNNIKKIHFTVCGGLLGSKAAVNYFIS